MKIIKPNYKKYFIHLAYHGSFIGRIYRELILYPRLNHFLKGKTLDLGCGIGHMVAFRRGTVGCDINPYNISFCKKKKLEAYLMKPDKLPFKNQSFESVFMDNVLEHIASPNKLIGEIIRVLKPGGILLIGVPGVKGFKRDDDHKIFYNESKLVHLAKQHNFKVNHFFYMPFVKSKFLNHHLNQYCIYTQWSKDK
jgi:SAM-dependent methyltransferase